jgi:hypothetical protein
MPIAFLRFSIHRRFHGTAAPGTSEAQATSSVFAAQERSAASCCDPIGPSQTTGTEAIRSVGVIDILTPRFSEDASRPYSFVTASAVLRARETAKAVRGLSPLMPPR